MEREAERIAYKPPEIRHDKQGDMSTDERVEKAMHHFVKNFNSQTASYLDGCLHCGMCAEACHFHVRTDDPRYTPIWKIELFKQAYKREAGPFAFFAAAAHWSVRWASTSPAWYQWRATACSRRA
jgi:ferredoxin